MGISIGLVGLGGFGGAFAHFFKAHPLVNRIALCDREPERIRRFADDHFFHDKFNPKDAYASLDDICRSDLDALVIITQPWLHAPQCIQTMESGKHVFSAVPVISIPDDDETLDWCDRLINVCRKTGMFYMLGETTFYRPEAMFCRRKAREGAFGNFIYAEGEYFHDLDASCNLREVAKSRLNSRAGQEWIQLKKNYDQRGVFGTPMHYPTHSTCGPVCTMQAHALKVVCHGYRNRNQDPHFATNEFSNQSALFKMSNGATVRICEFREVALPESETFRVYGTRGTYTNNQWFSNERSVPFTAQPLKTTALTPEEMRDPLPLEVQAAFQEAMHPEKGKVDLQNVEFQPTGHGGSHPYLVHEFVDAIANGRQPAINIWEAVRYMAMGIAANKSALNDGASVDVPDWGDAPK